MLVFGAKIERPFSEAERQQYGKQIDFDPRFPSDRYRQPSDVQAHFVGRLLLRRALRAFGGGRPPILSYSEYERPYFARGPHFSIAHSGSYVLCAVSDHRVGIDVERIRPINLAEMQPSFSASEWTAISSGNNSIRRFFDYWTRQEAVTKADGRGLLIAEQVILRGNQARIEETVWHLHPLSIEPGYAACLASSKPGSEPKMIRIDY